MSNKIVVRKTFQKQAKRLAKRYKSFPHDLQKLVEELRHSGSGFQQLPAVRLAGLRIDANVADARVNLKLHMLLLRDNSSLSECRPSRIRNKMGVMNPRIGKQLLQLLAVFIFTTNTTLRAIGNTFIGFGATARARRALRWAFIRTIT